MFKTGGSILSTLLTLFVLLVVTVIIIFGGLIALNGVAENKALMAMVIWLVFQVLILLFVGAFAGWVSDLLILRSGWNKGLAVVLTVFSGSLLGILLSFFAVIISMLLAGIN